MRGLNKKDVRISKRGFTLIELLIVIAIIGILAAALLVSLGGARQSARDARRIADLRNVQSALELFFNKCGAYPADKNCNIAQDPGTWAAFSTVLKDSNIGVNNVPDDPTSPSKTYRYSVSGDNQQYILGATLESDNQVLQKQNITCFGSNCACDKSPDTREYCVGL